MRTLHDALLPLGFLVTQRTAHGHAAAKPLAESTEYQRLLERIHIDLFPVTAIVVAASVVAAAFLCTPGQAFMSVAFEGLRDGATRYTHLWVDAPVAVANRASRRAP